MNTHVKKQTTVIALIFAVIASVAIGTTCFVSSAFADNADDENTFAAKIVATFNEDGTINVPPAKIVNDTDYVIELNKVTLESDLSFVSDWTNDFVEGTTINPGDTLIINWNATSKVPTDFDGTTEVKVGTITYTYSYDTQDKKALPDGISVDVPEGGYTYDGNPQTPKITGFDGLVEGKDYKVEYKDNTNAGTATVIITGIGDYAGSTKTIEFTINPKKLTDEELNKITLTIPSEGYTYDGNEKKPEVAGIPTGLVENTDYEITYDNNVNVTSDSSKAKVTVTFKGNYEGSKECTFTISPASITGATITTEDLTYNGDDQTVIPTVKIGETILVKDRDYTVSNNTGKDAKTYDTLTIEGMGNYKDSKTGSFTINPKEFTKDELNNIKLTIPSEGYTYDGTAKKPTIDTSSLPSGITADDYDVTYSNNTDAGKASVTITFKGNYTGSKELTFSIDQVDLSSATVTIDPKETPYTGSAITPTVTVKLGTKTLESTTDYTLSGNTSETKVNDNYIINIDGAGNYKGNTTCSWKITAVDISRAEDLEISISGGDLTYNGEEQTAKPIVKLGNTVLTQGEDYTVSDNKATNKGDYTLTITGIDSYSGTKTADWKIKELDISKASLTIIKKPDQASYTGEEVSASVDKITLGNVNFQDGDWTVDTVKSELKGTEAGNYKVYVIPGANGNCTGEASGTWTIGQNTLTEDNVVVNDVTYDGNPHMAEPTVTFNGKTLVKGTDYAVSGDITETNVATGGYKLTVTGKGNYSGEVDKTWYINPCDLTGATLTISQTSDTYTGSPIGATVTGATLKDKTTVTLGSNDFDVTSGTIQQTSADTYYITITGKGNYKGESLQGSWTINPKEFTQEELNNITLTIPSEGYTYDGNEKKPGVTGIPEGLVKGTDYDIVYSNNVNAGTNTAKATVKFKGNYTGEKECTFTINPKEVTQEELNNITLTIPSEGYTYDGNEKKPGVTGIPEGLVKGTDYDIVYSNNVNAGTNTAKVSVKFKGDYSGEKELSFTIGPKEVGITWTNTSFTYDGDAKTPTATVTSVVDGEDAPSVTITYTDFAGIALTSAPIDAGVYNATATELDNSNYKLPTTKPTTQFIISSKQVTDDELNNITLTIPSEGYTYDGNEKKPEVAGIPTGLVENTDYEITYNNNVNVTSDSSKAKVTVTFKGNYEGSKECTFTISPASITGATITTEDLTYNGDDQTVIPTVKIGETILVKDRDYTVSNNTGKDAKTYDTLTIEGMGNYKDSKTGSFTINPREVGITWTNTSFTYDGKAKTPTATVTGVVDGESLNATLAYEDTTTSTALASAPINAGSYSAQATGLSAGNSATNASNYKLPTPNPTQGFTINSVPITDTELNNITVTIPSGGYTYDGNEKKPEVAGIPTGLTAGTDYDIVYSNNVNAGTNTAKVSVKFKGNYSGEKELSFTIGPKTVTIAWTPTGDASYIYDGAAKTPTAAITGTVGNDALTAVLTYTDSLNTTSTAAPSAAGTYTATVTSFVAKTGTTTLASNYALPTAGTTKGFKITSIGNYYLNVANASNPESGVLKAQSQIDEDIEVLRGTKTQTSAGKDKAAVTTEYTNYMNGKDASGNAKEIRLYTKWSGSTMDKSGTEQAANKYVEFRIIQVGAHDSDGSVVTFMATHALPTAKNAKATPFNTGGWYSSPMRGYMTSYVANGLSGLVSGGKVKAVNKTTAYSASISDSWSTTAANSTTSDQFWLLSYTETFGSNSTFINGSKEKERRFKVEGTQYAWCKNNVKNATDANDILKGLPDTRANALPSDAYSDAWYLRSPDIYNCYHWGVVDGDTGTPAHAGSTESSGWNYSVVPAFAM